MHVSKNPVSKSLDKQFKNFLFTLISDIKSPEEAESIFSDILTTEELEIISKRLAIGYYIKSQRTYENICNNLKVSSTTISTISKKIEKGGFSLALKKIGAEEWAQKWSKRILQIVK